MYHKSREKFVLAFSKFKIQQQQKASVTHPMQKGPQSNYCGTVSHKYKHLAYRSASMGEHFHQWCAVSKKIGIDKVSILVLILRDPSKNCHREPSHAQVSRVFRLSNIPDFFDICPVSRLFPVQIFFLAFLVTILLTIPSIDLEGIDTQWYQKIII